MLNTSFTGPYSVTTSYNIGDLVIYGGKLYQSVVPSVALSPLTSLSWSLISNGFQWNDEWSANTYYVISNTVKYNNVGFIAVSSNNINNQPNTSPNFWRTFNDNYKNVVTNQPGDIQYQGNISPERIPVGNVNRILAITSDGTPGWLNLKDTIPTGNANQFLSLAANGQVYWKNAVVTANLGDIQYQGANGVYISLPAGANGTVLTANANNYLFWSNTINVRVQNLFDISTASNTRIQNLSDTSNTSFQNLSGIAVSTNTRISNVSTSLGSSIHTAAFNYSNGTSFYANTNLSSYTDSIISIQGITYNSNGFVSSFTETVNSSLSNTGTRRYNITYFANNFLNTITYTTL